ncbi:MAG: hydroxymethylpyrimidine/phosphomethylpyrimidine kinase [Pseudomonadales bacterium]|nr:hydroxymethylpyrimidine/phosphomethylpyrimidine kinase [Pseudomonadales bacterium]
MSSHTEPDQEWLSPIVLCFSGLDPSGGAGISADIEAIASLGCHCAPIITTLTAQDSSDVKDIQPVESTFLISQARAILEDMPVKAIKIGLLGSVAVIEAIHTVLRDYPNIPVILDPVLVSGGGTHISSQEIIAAMVNLLLPQTTLITPNTNEAQAIAAQADTIDACAYEMMEMGSEYVLITGTHDDSDKVLNRLWGHNRSLLDCEWERLPNEYHGSGCVLAAGIAAGIAQGMNLQSAVREAQAFTWHSLKNGQRLGMGQVIPNRLFWTNTEKANDWRRSTN